MMFLVGRGLYVVLVIWVISFFLIWRLMTYTVYDDSNGGEFPSCSECHHFRSQIFLEENGTSGPKHKTIPVYIVEEHHEVIKYWYSAVEKGYIPSKGNILFHIDAHSDGGTPAKWILGPLFRTPKDSSEIGKMMQGNDRFVVAAVLAGLITRYIWVWPPWNTESFENQAKADYIVMKVRIGTTYIRTKGGKMELELCACATSANYAIDNYCFANNASNFDDVDGIPIKEADCAIRTSLLIEVVSAAKAKQLLGSGTWIRSVDSVILDVDEDYYGVEPAGQPLYDVGVTNDQIDDISDWSANLLCAESTQQERRIDHFFHSLIQLIIDFKIFHSHERKKGQPIKKIKKLLAATFKTIISNNGLNKLLCYSWPQSLIVLKHLVAMMVIMTDDQLNALANVGLCLERSPKTYGFKYGPTMRLCSGYNRPNESAVMFHTPSEEDIIERTREIEKLLVQEYFVPGVVTICRSVRDGYTPRHLASVIESDILSVLLTEFPHIYNDSIYYDKDLLSGPHGRYGRY